MLSGKSRSQFAYNNGLVDLGWSGQFASSGPQPSGSLKMELSLLSLFASKAALRWSWRNVARAQGGTLSP
jgi:hypothetical protein